MTKEVINNMQKAYFPMKTINISQGYGSGSHKYSYALDLSGKDGGRDDVFAPFDCKVTKTFQPRTKSGAIDTKRSPEVWLTSTKPVLCANGYYGYLTMSLTHSPEVYKMKLNQTYKQFQWVCTEQEQGVGKGNHIHLELSKGTTADWDLNIIKKYKSYVNVNKVKPEEYLFVHKDSTIRNSKGYKLMKDIDDVKIQHIKYVSGVDYEGLVVHESPKGTSNGLLQVGTKVIVYESKNGYSRVGDNQWVCSKYLKESKPSIKTVNAKDGLNVRKIRSIKKNNPIACLKYGTPVQVFKNLDGWSKVSPNTEAWVSSNFLK